jgi:hypothetical protein
MTGPLWEKPPIAERDFICAPIASTLLQPAPAIGSRPIGAAMYDPAPETTAAER